MRTLTALSAALIVLLMNVTGAAAFRTFQMSAQPLGGQQVKVSWSPYLPSATMDIYRDGAVIANVPNPPPSTTLTGEPTGQHTYKVCTPPTATDVAHCSINSQTITVT